MGQSSFRQGSYLRRSCTELSMRGPLRLIATAGGVVLGGFFALSMVSSVSVQAFRAVCEAKRRRTSPPCLKCRGKGFVPCLLCRGKSTIEWSPLFDPAVMKPCVCPTCEGNKIQRCLNCVGRGYA